MEVRREDERNDLGHEFQVESVWLYLLRLKEITRAIKYIVIPWLTQRQRKLQTVKKILPSLSLPSPVSSAHLRSYDRLFLVHNTQAWLPKKSRISCISSIVIFKKHLTFHYETHHVLLIPGPFLEDLQRLTGVEHTRCGKHHLRVYILL